MLKRLRAKKTAAEGTTEQHGGAIQKRIALLENIRATAESLVRDCEAVARLPDQDEGPLRNMAECFAIQIKLLADAYKDHPEENTALMQINKIYNGMGRIERKFQHDIKEQIIDPLYAWLTVDYVRINGEIQKLNSQTAVLEKAKEFAKKTKNSKDETTVEECKKACQGQTNVVKMELMKLPEVHNKHSQIFENFLALQNDYHRDLHAMMIVNNVSKWASTIVTGPPPQ